jgi:hypothetical protein
MANQNNTTAVDWLISKIPKLPPDIIPDEEWFGIIGEAREMFQEQIEQSYVEGCLDTYGCDEPDTNKTDEYFAEQYYSKTYGKSE